MPDTRPIGIFDSGIGGLTVLKAVRKLLPHEDIVYFADTVHMPYGNKAPAQIIDYAYHTLDWMQNEMGTKMVIVACHTSSAIAIDKVAKDYALPIIGTMHPTVQAILANPKHERLGVIATPASVASRRHETILKNAGFEGDIHLIACPEFVPLIEAGERKGERLEAVTRHYLEPFHTFSLDTLIYGCTHYPLIAELIESLLPKYTCCLDPALFIAKEVKEQLENQYLFNSHTNAGNIRYYRSDPDVMHVLVPQLG